MTFDTSETNIGRDSHTPLGTTNITHEANPIIPHLVYFGSCHISLLCPGSLSGESFCLKMICSHSLFRFFLTYFVVSQDYRKNNSNFGLIREHCQSSGKDSNRGAMETLIEQQPDIIIVNGWEFTDIVKEDAVKYPEAILLYKYIESARTVKTRIGSLHQGVHILPFPEKCSFFIGFGIFSVFYSIDV